MSAERKRGTDRESALLIRDVTAVPMVPAGEVLEQVDILIEGTRLAGLGPSGSLTVPTDTRVL